MQLYRLQNYDFGEKEKEHTLSLCKGKVKFSLNCLTFEPMFIIFAGKTINLTLWEFSETTMRRAKAWDTAEATAGTTEVALVWADIVFAPNAETKSRINKG